ncbi:hypothetical protein ADU37_CDS13260 [Thermococcus sp. 2319x1]|nr:hypothetical protein ADU37_CDS13260 [Thermococcus sp. 2319x1]
MYLVTLKFRVHPLALSLSNPNELSQEMLTLDGPLAFAEYYKKKLSTSKDWRIKYLEDTLFPKKELEWASSIKSSYLLPTVLDKENEIVKLLTPMGFSALFSIDNQRAKYEYSKGKYPRRLESSQIILRLGRRDDILKAEVFRKAKNITLTKQVKLPSSQSGPYKAVDYTVKLYTTHILWASIVDGISKKELEDLLLILKKFGIGKKRNMGWGDLLGYNIYDLKKDSVTPEFIIHSSDDSRYLETIRPVSPKKIAELIGNPNRKTRSKKYVLIDSKLEYGADGPPYWRRQLVVKSALFQIT